MSVVRRQAVLLVALLVGAATVLVGRVPADAQSNCADPGGVALPFERRVADATPGPGSGRLDPDRLSASAGDDRYDVVFNGGGWGHGIGMSQYGAKGAAELGCDHETILETYYPGAQLATSDVTGPITVGLFPSTPSSSFATVINVENSGSVDLRFELRVGDPDDDIGTAPPVLTPGRTLTVRAEPQGGFTIRDGAGQGAPVLWPPQPADATPTSPRAAGARDDRLELELDEGGVAASRIRLSSKDGREYARGLLRFWSMRDGGTTGMAVGIGIRRMDQYLYGLGEVPSSWPAEALATQAVAARSFAAVAKRDRAPVDQRECRCTVYDSTSDQYYSGWTKESVAPSWNAAVDASADEVMVHDGEVVPTFYSSSNGGWSSAAPDVWGSDPVRFAYLGSVDTSRWDQVDANGDGEVDNPYHRWSVGYTDEELANRLGFTEVTDLAIERAPGGRPCLATSGLNPCAGEGNGFRVTGTKGVDGPEVTQTFSSEGIRSLLGGFPNSSDGFLSGQVGIDGRTPPFDPPPVVGDRLAGTNRYETAIALSRAGWAGGSDTAVLARADDPSDALAGSGLAGSRDAPLLLTSGARLTPGVGDELRRLGVSRVVLLGGANALGPGVVGDVRAAVDGVRVDRVAGADRYETAAAIAAAIAPDGADEVLVVRGRHAVDRRAWPDALSVSGLAARRAAAGAPTPILVVSDVLPDATRRAVADLGATRATVAGGTAAVAASVVGTLRDDGVDVTRLGGVDRYATSRLVAGTDDTSTRRLALATGNDFPDGLAAGPYAARTDATLLLVPPTLDAATTAFDADGHPSWLRGLGWDEGRATAVGGTNAVAEAVLDRVVSILLAAAPDGG